MSSLTGANLTSLINNLQDYQSLLTINELKASNAADLTAYTAAQKSAILADICGTKTRAFEKAYGDALMSADNYTNTLYYYRRNKELLDTNENIAKKSLIDAKSVVYNNDLAKRQFEINEWTVNNKRDTLFIFQFGFICLLIVGLLTYLKKMYLLPGGFYGWLVFFIAVVFTFTVAYRAVQTNKIRDMFYWSRRKFGSYGPPPASGGGGNCLLQSANEIGASIKNKTENIGDSLNDFWNSAGSYVGNVGSALAGK